MNKDLKARVLGILNDSLAPWTFDGAEPMTEHLVEAVEAYIAARLAKIQPGLSRVDPMHRSSPETVSCVFCGADKTYSYVTGNRTPHADDCEWRLACEARGIRWNHVL